MSDPLTVSREIQARLPEGGLFAEKTFRVSPEPFPLPKRLVKTLDKLGPVFHRFQRACDVIYRRSRKETLPPWIAGYLDRGKPLDLIEVGLSGETVEALPAVIRPDLILTDHGFIISEFDSVPGGIGLTGWLARIYGRLLPDTALVGGADGMVSGFRSIFPRDEADILISREAGDYRPEMDWLCREVGEGFRVEVAESYSTGGRDVYRFFELFDLPNLPRAGELGDAAAAGDIFLTSPFKPWLEEKAWTALFWALPLRDIWRKELRDASFRGLQEHIPRSWMVEPVDLPHQAALPGLDIRDFRELKGFSQSERELVLKLSGFHERAWGARSVIIGHDVSQEAWGEAVEEAIGSFAEAPYVLQQFHTSSIHRHPWFNRETDTIETMEGRVRLCPYYFVGAADRRVRLGGILATVVPADKKIIHGMADAILAPCCVV